MSDKPGCQLAKGFVSLLSGSVLVGELVLRIGHVPGDESSNVSSTKLPKSFPSHYPSVGGVS